MDLTLNINEAKLALTEKPMLATSAERVMILNDVKSDHKEWPQPRRFSYMIRALLSRVSTPLESYDLIAGRCVDRLLTDEEEAIFKSFLAHPDHPRKGIFFSSGHGTYDWEYVIQKGLPGMRADAEASLAVQTNEDERQFLLAIIEIYDALRDFMLRYADAADAKGMGCVAANLRKAATQRPDGFYAALQLCFSVAFLNCAYVTPNPTLTLGRLDQLLYPLYVADLSAGRLTREGAGELITDYYCKHNLMMGRGEHQVGDATNSTTFDRIYNFDAPQYLLLAGTDEKGEDAVNDLTMLFVERIVPAFKNPVVVVRYFKGMNEKHPQLWQTLCERSLQSASLMYYNDDNVRATYRRMGLPEEDIADYVHFGCNWPGIGINGAWIQIGPSSRYFNCYRSDEEKNALRALYPRYLGSGWPVQVTEVLRTLVDREDLTMDDVYDSFFERWGEYVEQKLERQALEIEVRQRRPAACLSLTDCFLASSVRSAHTFGAESKYYYTFQSFYMFGSTVDCMIVVDQLVFKQKKLTLRELLAATDANFEGYPHVLALCRSVDKYGSDTAHSNAHAKRLAEGATSIVIEKNKPYLKKYGIFLEPCLQSDTWHLKEGLKSPATVDGRLANTPYSQNSRPANGNCKNGITAMLHAMLNLPADGVLSGALNLDVDQKDFVGERGRAVFGALLSTYLNNGGLHAQVTALSREDLVDAQQNPNAHRDLRVRVTGYSGVFVDICKDLQDDIIKRFN